MDYVVELMLDSEATQAVAELTRTLYAACGGQDLLGLGLAPHISLTALIFSEDAAPDLAPVERILSRFAAATRPMASAFQAVATFPTDQGVVYLAPTVTMELLTAHRALLDDLAALHIPTATYYRPGVWIPHCTIAQGLPADNIGRAVELARGATVFRPFTLIEVRLIQVRPMKELARWPLSLTADL